MRRAGRTFLQGGVTPLFSSPLSRMTIAPAQLSAIGLGRLTEPATEQTEGNANCPVLATRSCGLEGIEGLGSRKFSYHLHTRLNTGPGNSSRPSDLLPGATRMKDHARPLSRRELTGHFQRQTTFQKTGSFSLILFINNSYPFLLAYISFKVV